ncbi:unnamed protein product [Spirodela intermedia]|uniref:Metallothionein-like protein n=1 Tax=Spirodela intermedia TaxID=51605 RepID=A0A7I8K6S6_SPIIN|nr:unnamed protein product [Spirodela intermedia]
MSCTSGKCVCGGCGGSKMFPDLDSEEKIATTGTMIMGVASARGSFESFAMVAAVAENDCKCGSNCTCK